MSRQMKKLLGGNTLPPPDEESDKDYEPLFIKIPQNFQFQGLVLSSNSESDHEPNDMVEIEALEAEKLPKKKKKKKKQRKVKDTTTELNYDPEMDEIDRSVLEVNAILGSPPPPPASASADCAAEGGVMSVQLKNLNYSNELRRKFGPEEDEKTNRRRVRVPSLLRKRWIIVPPPGDNNITNYRRYGLSMSVNRTENGFTYFTFDHGLEYQKVHRAYLQDFGSEREVPVLHLDEEARLSMHVEALLQTADTIFRTEDYTSANSLIEKAIVCMQSTFHPSFNLADSKVRLEYKFLENRPFHIGILKYLHLLTNRACHRTALELGKLLLNLDPSDPLGVLLLIDVVALRAREHAWLIDAIDHWTKERDAGFLFNMQYSYAMAHFHLTKKAKGDLTHADELLEKAILRFPLVAVKIFEYANLKMSDKAKASALFNSVADSGTIKLKDLIILYTKFVWQKWREPGVLQWLTSAVNRLADRYEQDRALQEQVRVWTNERMNLFQSWPEQISRHLLVIRPMGSLLIDGPVPSVGRQFDLTCDPAPPAATVDRYGYRNRAASRVPAANSYSAFMQLFQSLMPHYDIVFTEQNGEDDADEINEHNIAAMQEENIREMLAAGLRVNGGGVGRVVGAGVDGADGGVGAGAGAGVGDGVGAGVGAGVGDGVGGGSSDSEEEFELQLAEEEPNGPDGAANFISIGNLTNAIRHFMTVYETGIAPEERPISPPPEDRQNDNPGDDN